MRRGSYPWAASLSDTLLLQYRSWPHRFPHRAERAIGFPLNPDVTFYGCRRRSNPGIIRPMDRIAVIARLEPGSEERTKELLDAGPPFDLAASGIVDHAVYVGNDLIVFVFEGVDVESRLTALVNDPVLSASFGAWVTSPIGCSPAPARDLSLVERGVTARRTWFPAPLAGRCRRNRSAATRWRERRSTTD